MSINSFLDLDIYQISEELTELIYRVSRKFPKEERYALISQVRRAVLSIGANIAESFGRFHRKDKINFLYHARGSLMEVRHFLNMAHRLGYISDEESQAITRLCNRQGVKLNNYIQTIKKSLTT